MISPTETTLPRIATAYGLSLAVLVVIPVLFAVVATVMGGLAPDGAFPFWAGGAVLEAPDPTLTGAAAEADRVQRWLAYVEDLAPGLTETLPRFAWQTPVPADPEALVRTGLEMAAIDLGARYAFAVPACILILLSIPVTIAAIRLIASQGRRWLMLGLAGTGLATLVGVRFEDTNPVRLFTAEYLLGKAALDESYRFFTPRDWWLTFATVEVVSIAALTAAGAVILLFAGLARRAVPEDTEAAQRALRRRAGVFRTALILGSAVLVLGVASAHGLIHWSSALLAPEATKPVSDLASAAGLYWGLLYSLALLGVSVPAALSIHLDMRALAARAGRPHTEIAKEAGFAFDLRQSLAALTTIAGPLMTGPALELIRAVSTSV